nr:hypothetical protein [Tanacetum cinerariifolium]
LRRVAGGGLVVVAAAEWWDVAAEMVDGGRWRWCGGSEVVVMIGGVMVVLQWSQRIVFTSDLEKEGIDG